MDGHARKGRTRRERTTSFGTAAREALLPGVLVLGAGLLSWMISWSREVLWRRDVREGVEDMARKGGEARSSGSGKERREGRSASLDEELQRRDGTELLVKALGM